MLTLKQKRILDEDKAKNRFIKRYRDLSFKSMCMIEEDNFLKD